MPRIVGLALATLAICTSVGVPLIHAQTLPSANGTDLTLPPDLRERAGRPTATQETESRKRHHAGRTEKVAHPAPLPVGPAQISPLATDPHPVDLGVTMRGGSGTARAYAPTGDSEVLQESGSAFGAGMKFGF